MKSLYIGLLCVVLVASCKSETSKPTETKEPKSLSIAEKIANAHGFQNWENVSEVKFTFQVDVDTIKGKGRSWQWKPKSDEVTMVAGEQSVTYNRNTVDSTLVPADRAFINDKYWLFVPFQLVWDNSAKISTPKTTEAPLSKKSMNMITVTYPKEGGYTPGDAYDIFYDEDYIIREWIYRKNNAETPSLTTTFENYQDFKGIKIAKDHKKDAGSWNLNFTDLEITVE